MAERVDLAELRGAVEKAAADVLKSHEGDVVGHGPIVLGFVAPEALAEKDAQAIAEKVAAASGLKGRPTVIGVGASDATEREAALPNPIRIIIGLILSQTQ